MIINLGVWINDSMSSSEKRIAIQKNCYSGGYCNHK